MEIKKGVRFKVEHNKKLFYVIIILLILFVLLIVFIVSNQGNKNVINESNMGNINGEVGNECSVDSDCVPEICCHASSCVSKNKAPDCSNILCTMECVEGTLDCRQGECSCVNRKCEVIIG